MVLCGIHLSQSHERAMIIGISLQGIVVSSLRVREVSGLKVIFPEGELAPGDAFPGHARLNGNIRRAPHVTDRSFCVAGKEALDRITTLLQILNAAGRGLRVLRMLQ